MSHKRPKHKKKEQKKQVRKIRSLAKRRNIYAQLFDILEIRDKINDLPESMKTDICNFSWPQILIDTSKISELPIAQELEKLIKEELDKETIEINGKLVFISAVNYLIGLKELIAGWYLDFSSLKKTIESKAKSEKFSRKKEELNKIHDNLNYINSKLSPMLNGLYQDYASGISSVACKRINAHFDFENGIYPKFRIGKTDGNKIFPIIEIHKISLKKEKLKILDQERTAYPCHFVSLFGISPISFKTGVIGNSKEIPIYVQDHAINRLKERINIKPTGYILDCLGRSLFEPIVAAVDGDSYLVEYRLYNYKLGYLVVSKTEEFALVRSFKFITMTGTPEFKNLTRKFRATKHDVTYLGLDTMDVFINSDIPKDKELKAIFEECGLGHLFDLSTLVHENGVGFESSKRYTAEEIRQYFNF